MMLVDTSVWVYHFRRGNARLKLLLEDDEVATHPMVLGELACGNLARSSDLQEALAATLLEASHTQRWEWPKWPTEPAQPKPLVKTAFWELFSTSRIRSKGITPS